MQKRNASVVLMMSRRLLDSGWLLVLHFLAMVAPRDGVALKMPPKKRVLDKTALGAFKTYFNFREKLENHDTQRMRGVPVDQRVWSDAPAK